MLSAITSPLRVCLSATRTTVPPFEPLVPDFSHITYNDAAALDEAIDFKTAAVLIEVVQGEGGVRLAPDGFREISRAKLIDPTQDQLDQRGGVTWSHPAFADRCIYARNDKELVCADLSHE